MRMLVVALMMMSGMLLSAGASDSESKSSKRMADIVAWHRSRIPRSVQQTAMLCFVDTSGDLVSHMVEPSELNLSDRELIQACMSDVDSITEEIRRDNLNWYDALSYAQQVSKATVSYEQLVEIQRRIVGGDESLSGLRNPGVRQEVMSYVEQLNSGIKSILKTKWSLEQRIVESSKLAAWSILTLKDLHPFVDGNGRVIEVINSVIMRATGVAPFPFRVHSYYRGYAAFYTATSFGLMKGSRVVSSEEMTDYVLLKLWTSWSLINDDIVNAVPLSLFDRLLSAGRALGYPF